MSWPQWPMAQAGVPLPSVINSAPPVINPTAAPSAAAGLLPGTQYTPEQWTQMQQQNWQQWAQWQQQYQQWHQQYGAEYQKSLNALNSQPPAAVPAPIQNTIPNTSMPPPLPHDAKPKPPLPPPDEPGASVNPPEPKSEESQGYMYNTTTPNWQNSTYGKPNSQINAPPPSLMSLNVSKPDSNFGNKRSCDQEMGDSKRVRNDSQSDRWNTNRNWSTQPPVIDTSLPPPQHAAAEEELSESEKRFMKQFQDWENQFIKWKEQNANHPDKEQYKQYEKKWETWRAQLLERREQMRRKRLSLAAEKTKTSFNTAKPALLPTPQPDMNKPPPNFNNRPLDFKVPPPSKNDDVICLDDDNNEGLFKSNFGGGIPGLDLVKDDKEDGLDDQKDVFENLNKPPDYDAISKGINSILGDEKILSILSKVSQQQSMGTNKPIDSFAKNMVGVEMSTHNINSNDSFSNDRSNAGYDNFNNTMPLKPDVFANVDEQTRSSFGGQYDMNRSHNYAGPSSFNRGPNSFQQNDKLNKNTNFKGALNTSQDNIRKFDNAPTCRDNFNTGFDNTGKFTKSYQNFDYNEEDDLNNDPFADENEDNQNNSRDNFNRGPNNRGNWQETNKGPVSEPFNRGAGNLNRSSDNFNQGPDNFNRGSDKFNCGPDNYYQGPDNFNEGPVNFNRGSDNFNRGPNNFERGPNNFNRGPDHFNRGPDNFNRGPDNFNRGPNNFRSGTDNFDRYPEDYGEGSEDYRRPGDRGFDNFDRDRGDFQGYDDYNRGSDQYGRDGDDFKRSQDDFRRGGGDFQRGSSFNKDYRGPDIPAPFGGNNGGFNRSLEDKDKYNNDKLPSDPAPLDVEKPVGTKLVQPLNDLNQDNAHQEEDFWKPANIIDYDHKPNKKDEFDVSIEPCRTYDYRHKPVNRIPLPDRPKWLHLLLKPYPEFEPSIVRPYDRFPVQDRYDSWKSTRDTFSSNRRYEQYKFAEESKLKEERSAGRLDERRGDRYEPRGRYDSKRSTGDRKRSVSPVRKLKDERGRDSRSRERTFDDRKSMGRDRDFDRRTDERRDRDRKNDDRKYGSDRRREDWGNDKKRSFEDEKSSNDYGRRDDRRDRDSHRNDKSDNYNKRQNYRNEENRSEDSSRIDNDSFENKPTSDMFNKPPPKQNITLIDDLLSPPGRFNRPARIVIILRGPPGSGKTFLAKLIKDKEMENGGSAPRILSLDDYFMVEQEKEIFEDGKKVKIKEMVYEFEEGMEASYRASLFKSFKKTITDGYFPFIIVDNINDKVKYFGEMWSFAKQNGFQVYISQLELDVQLCSKRNTHGRTEADIQKCVKGWEPTPPHHPILDCTSLIQAGSIPEVEMEEIDSPASEEGEQGSDEEQAIRSKWDTFDCSVDKLAKLDGTNKPLRASKTMEDYLQLEDEWTPSVSTKPGQKRVRWADLEERKQQEKMRAIGFVVGQTDWSRMMDPTMGSGALTQTKYIERVRKY